MTASDRLRDIVPDRPDVWGEGALFAFSGFDGATVSAAGFVGSLWSPRYDVLFHLDPPRRLRLRVPEPATPLLCTGDTLSVGTPGGPLLITWSAWHTLVGVAPPGAEVALVPEPAAVVGTWSTVTMPQGQTRELALARGPDGRFALGFGFGAAEAAARAQAGLRDDPWDVAEERQHALHWLRLRADALLAESSADSRAAPLSPADSRLLNKCLSVMRVNTLAAEGVIGQTWSTPDRIPHRHMWLWDSVFHAMALSPLDPSTAWRFLKSVMDFALPDGAIPITMCVDGTRGAGMTQPPVLAWGVWWNYLHTGERRWLAEAFPRIEGYLLWNLRHRDRNGNGLLEWTIENDPACRCGESGMDNSPRFDDAEPLDAVDFSAFQAHEMRIAGLIARELDRPADAERWFAESRRMSERIHAQLWDPARGFYVDRAFDGRLSPVEAASGFTPLLLDDCPPDRVAALVRALRDPSRFGTPTPVPSVSRSHPAFSHDMWRGPAWANYNFLIALGLRRHGQSANADDIVRRTVATVRKHYEAAGVLFEYYDALDERSPAACDRKGRRSGAYLSRPYGDAVRDYHWAAALTACHLLSIDGAWREPAAGERAVIRPNPKRRAYEALTRGVPFDLFAAAPASRAVPGPFPVPAPPDALDRWREDRVGMFVHWNMSALRSCTISWAMNYGGVPPDEYYALTRRFNPRHFDAREWAELVRGCGFANLLFVVKHHDGFALWDTDTTDLKITNTPYDRDLWRELTDACHRAGLPIGAYYSPADWQHPAARRGDWPAYYRFMRQQWRELFERYGRLDTFECDYWQDFCPQDDWAGFYRELRRRQPDVLFSRNTAWAAGDFEVHEWGVGRMTCDGQPPGPPPHEWTVMPDNAAWESLMSVDGRRWWSYNPDPCISFERLMAWVLASVVNDGNILCNFTPMASGEFPDDQLRLMYAFRDWMKVHAESIRGTRGGPYRPLHECGGAGAGSDAAADAAPVMLAQSYGQAHLVPRVGSTRAGNRIYLHILTRLPGRWLSLPSPGPALRGASRLGAPGAPVEVRERDGSLLVRVPDEAGRQVDTVVVLDFAGSVMSAPPMDMSVARSPAT